MAEPDSTDTREGRDAGDERHAAEADEAEAHEQQTAEQDQQGSSHLVVGSVGNVPPLPSSDSPAGSESARTHARDVAKRLQREGRWKEVEPVRDQMMKDARKAFPDKEARQAWVYGELDRIYPPLEIPIRIGNSVQPAEDTESGSGGIPIRIGNSVGTDSDTYRKLGDDSGSITGLADLPGDWPKLPANASLGAEIGWVQANRLRIVEERPGRATVVRLDRAESPAPSLAALGWLETSIRSYAKYVDVAAKASGADDEGESAVMRRERKSVEEVRALIHSMAEAEGACPHCGRSG